MLSGRVAMSLLGISLSLLLLGSECLPIQKRLSDSSEQPSWCKDARPRSSQTSPCEEDETVRRFFLHESNPRGCKKFGICPEDAAKYDNQTQNNYFLDFESCQRQCMQHVQCPELPNDGNVVKVSDNGLQGWGKRIVFECTEGYSFSDNSERITRTCQKNGTWSGAAPVCLKQCPAPPPIEQARIAPSKELHSQSGTVHYTCDIGYELRGSALRTCGPNGMWIEPEPSCVCQTGESGQCLRCPEPRPIDHGNVSAPSRSVSALMMYSCNAGYWMIGNSSRVCEENGMWSGTEPICWKLTISNTDTNREVTNTTVTVRATETVNFVATSSEPNPFLGVEPAWSFQDGQDLPHSVTTNKLSQNMFALSFPSIFMSKEQRGEYSITLGGFTVSFMLEIQDAPPKLMEPVILKRYHSTKNMVTFTCIVDGCPIPDVEWYHDGQRLEADDRRRITLIEYSTTSFSELIIFVPTLNDSGSYTCVGKNSAGNMSATEEWEAPTPSAPAKETSSSSSSSSSSATQTSLPSEETAPARRKRAMGDIAQSLLCSSSANGNTVTVLGQVRRESRKLRSSSDPSTYRVQVKDILRGESAAEQDSTMMHQDSDTTRTSWYHIRTVVLEPSTEEEISGGEQRLRSNTDYVFLGRIVDDTLFVQRHNVHRHTPQLQRQLQDTDLC